MCICHHFLSRINCPSPFNFREWHIGFLWLPNNYPKHGSLNSIHLLSHGSGGRKSTGSPGFWALALLTRQNPIVDQTRLLPGSSGRESASRPIQVVGRIQFCATLGVSSPFPFWLSAGSALSFYRLLACGPLSPLHHQSQQRCLKSFWCSKPLWTSYYATRQRQLCF